MMDLLVLARVVHVMAVVVWIGGVTMVTFVLLPMTLAMENKVQGVHFFHQVERRFATLSRVTTLLAGLSGFTMLQLTGAWHLFASLDNWHLHLMALVWTLFSLLLFILEPFVFAKHFICLATANPTQVMDRVRVVHWILVGLSFLAIAGGVSGAHGKIF